MARRIEIHQVDAFTTRRFTGNPAGVVLHADELQDAEMLAIARELNNADTAFILAPNGPDHDLRARFFTPRAEVGFVGHATVAAHFILSSQDAGEAHQRRQRSRAGVVSVEIRGSGPERRIAVRQSCPPLGREINERERLAVLDSLALASDDVDERGPMQIVGSGSTRLMVGVRSAEELKQLKPDFARLTTLSAQIGAAGYFVFTLAPRDDGCLSEARMFCPALGISEDPVSGNAHGLLGAYLVRHGLIAREGRRANFSGVQGQYVNRPGRVDVELEFEDGALDGVWIIGQAVSIFHTTITL